MKLAHRDLFLEDVCKRFYVENLSKAAIAKATGLARNTVRKYIENNPIDSAFVQDIITKSKELKPVVESYYQFPNFQVALHNAISYGDPNLKHLNLLNLVNDHAKEVGIKCLQDFIKLEIAYENYLLYKCMSRRYVEMSGKCLDVSWLESTDKMSKLTTRHAESGQKFLKVFCDMLKELEIKYGKRSPDYGRIQNLNIQKNEINVGHVSSETLQGQASEA